MSEGYVVETHHQGRMEIVEIHHCSGHLLKAKKYGQNVLLAPQHERPDARRHAAKPAGDPMLLEQVRRGIVHVRRVDEV